ncbi:MAG TPA: MFS transporter [Candidatus Limnocylindrales bacterium]|nr:MFS transporter [Candidatus Limnocylindrales bacterium]
MHDQAPATPPDTMPAAATPERDEHGRPTRHLPWGKLLALNAYWLAIGALWAALIVIVVPDLVDTLIGRSHQLSGLLTGILSSVGVYIAIVVQPTIGAISDNTRSRWGRRKPYIFWGTVFDMLFLSIAAYAFLNASPGDFRMYGLMLLAIVLLQFSSNFAQGPYQGYVPDLVPTAQVGVASGLFGLANLVGNLGGAAVAVFFLSEGVDFPLGIFLFVGAVELVTMLITVLRVPDSPGPPTERTLLERAKAAWGTDILEQRAYVWLLASRLFVLMAQTSLTVFGVYTLANYFDLELIEAQARFIPILIAFGMAALVSSLPGGWISTRVGRKPVIYAGIAAGIVSAATIGLANDYALIVAMAVPMGICYGVFAAVDWALMTDIIPKAESGRYMGISNVVTGGSQAVAPLLGGVLSAVVITALTGPLGAQGAAEVGYRAIFGLMIVEFVIGAWALRHVPEPMRRGRRPAREAGEAAASA